MVVEWITFAYASYMSNMLAILSPAKTMEMNQPRASVPASRPRLGSHTKQLAEELQGYSAKKLGTLMSISDKLALLNEDRWQCFGDRTNPRGPAAICFRGDVYQGWKPGRLIGAASRGPKITSESSVASMACFDPWM